MLQKIRQIGFSFYYQLLVIIVNCTITRNNFGDLNAPIMLDHSSFSKLKSSLMASVLLPLVNFHGPILVVLKEFQIDLDLRLSIKVKGVAKADPLDDN